MKIFFAGIGLIFLGSLGVGCGEMNHAIAPRNNISIPATASFPKKSIRLNRADLFLWRNDMTSEKMTRVLKLGEQQEDLEAKSGPINEKIQSLSDQIQPLLDQIEEKELTLIGIKESISQKQNDLSTAPELDKPAIQKEIDELSTQKAAVESDLKNLKSDENYRKKVALELELKSGQTQLQLAIDEIKTLVHFYDPPPQYIDFQFKSDGSFIVNISRWMIDSSDGPRDFTSKVSGNKPPTITGLEYRETGGRVNFDVQVYDLKKPDVLTAIYHFDVARSNLDKNNGKTYFTGNLTRKVPQPDGSFISTQGVAKFVDKNN